MSDIFFIALLSSHSPLDFLISVNSTIFSHICLILGSSLTPPSACIRLQFSSQALALHLAFPSSPHSSVLHHISPKLLSWNLGSAPPLASACRPWGDTLPCIPHVPPCQSNLLSLSSSSRLTPALRLSHFGCSLDSALHTPAQMWWSPALQLLHA